MSKLEVVYILFRFPNLTETFVAEEIQKIQKLDVKIKVFSLLKPKEDLVHPVSSSILPVTQYVPRIINPSIWAAQFHYLIKNPGLYFRLLWTLLKQPTKYFRAYLQRLTIFFKAVWAAKALQSSQIQLIHTHFAWLSAAASWIVSQLLDVPFSVTAHAFDIYSEKNDLLNLITDQAAKIITISDINKKNILKMNSRISENKIHVIRCGIDLSFFSNENYFREPIGNPLEITSVGSLIEKKGHEFLIKACSKLKEKDIPFHCVIIGTGPQHDYLENLIKENNLVNEVILPGRMSQDWVKERLRSSQMFVLACVTTEDNDQDGIPVAIMEAIAMGVPVISTAVSGIPELIKHEKTGLLVKQRDPDALAAAMIRLSEHPEKGEVINQNSYELIEREYDIHKNVEKLREIFSTVVERT